MNDQTAVERPEAVSDDELAPDKLLPELERCEAVIEKGLMTFFEVGTALAEIRDRQLYRVKYMTFENYIKHRWKHGRNWGYAAINAAKAVDCLPRDTKQQPNMKQAVALAKAPEEKRAEVWEGVVEEAEETGEPITAGKVVEKVEEVSGSDAACNAIDEATQGKHGNPTGNNQHGTVDNVNSSTNQERPTGASRDAASGLLPREKKPIREWVPEVLDTINQLLQAIQEEAVVSRKNTWSRGADTDFRAGCGVAAMQIEERANSLAAFFESLTKGHKPGSSKTPALVETNAMRHKWLTVIEPYVPEGWESSLSHDRIVEFFLSATERDIYPKTLKKDCDSIVRWLFASPGSAASIAATAAQETEARLKSLMQQQEANQ